MRSSTLPTAALLTLALSSLAPGQAAADGYIGVGVGSNSDLQGDIASQYQTSEDSSSSRVVFGKRFGAVALEASVFGSQLQDMASAETDSASTLSLGVDLKYHLGLLGGFEGYGKIGLNNTWLTGVSGADYEGRGEAIGLGLQYSFNLAVTEIALWADYTIQRTELRDGDKVELDGELSMLNLGLSVGI